MSASSLPYTLLLLLAELAVGSLAMVTVFDARKQVTTGYVKAGAITIVPTAIFAMWTYIAISPAAEVDGYRLSEGWYTPFGVLFGLFLLASVAHAAFSLLEQHDREVVAGAAGSVVGAVAIMALGLYVSPPAWSPVLTMLSVLASAGVLGGSLMAMLWGHWYLTSGRLPKEPMEQMSLVVVAALVIQGVLVLLGAIVAPREVPLSDGLGVELVANPAFWLRVGVGLVFPLGVTWLAYKAAQIRGMMSATGLLYIALGAVLAGEGLARGLMFSTGHVV